MPESAELLKLRKENSLLQTLLENTPDVIVRLDRSRRRTYVSPAIERETGRPAAGFIGRSIEELPFGGKPGISHLLAEKLCRVFDDGIEQTLEFEAGTPNGKKVFHTRIFPERDESGRVASVLTISRDITERKRAEEQLRVTLESVADGFFSCDGEWRFVYVNEAAERMLGIDRASVLGRSHWEVFPLTLGTQLETEYRQAAAGEIRDFENHYAPWDRWYHHTCYPREGGGMSVYFRDITERKRSEKTLRETGQQFRELADSMPQLVWTARPDGTVDFYNQRAREYDGISRDAESGWRWAPVLHPEDLQRTEEAFADALRTGETYQAEHRVRMADGRFRWHLSRGVPGRDGDGRIIRWYGTATDIHEQKTAEETVRRSEEHYHRALRDSGLIAARVDSDLRYRWIFNPHPDFNGTEVIGKRDDELIGPGNAAGIMALKREVLETGQEILRELSSRNSDGVHWYSMKAVPLRDPEGNIVGLTTVSLDITDLKRTGEELRKANEEAQASRVQAETANRAKSEFLAHMSHELRTPIAGIVGMVDVLVSRTGTAEQGEHLELIKEAAQSLLAIVGDILDLSRIEAGHVALEPAEFEVRKEIESIVLPFRMPAGQKGLRLSLDIEEDVPQFIRADKEKIAQVLRNLVSNAVKYTERGSVRVSVGCRDERMDRRVRLQFGVSDTGAGIPQEKRDAIFESFVRLRSSVTDRAVDGTGLGLTISRRLVDLLGGTLSVESSPGTGSVFRFTVEAEVLEAKSGEIPLVDTSGLESLPPLRVLLAEDNRINQMFLSLMLTEAGHRVTVAKNGRDAVRALEAADQDGFDLVLMDVQMPVMDGLEATAAIRGLSGRVSAIPIIALTALAVQGDEDRFRSCGMDGYVTKPVDWNELARVIRELRGMRTDGR